MHDLNNRRTQSNLFKKVQQRNVKGEGIDWACSLRSPNKQSKRAFLIERLVRPSWQEPDKGKTSHEEPYPYRES